MGEQDDFNRIAKCRIEIADFAVDFVERLILVVMLGIILYMTVRYTDPAKNSKKIRKATNNDEET